MCEGENGRPHNRANHTRKQPKYIQYFPRLTTSLPSRCVSTLFKYGLEMCSFSVFQAKPRVIDNSFIVTLPIKKTKLILQVTSRGSGL